MQTILSCFVIFFLGFVLVACATQRKVIVGSNHNLVGFTRGSEAENGLLSVSANAAKRLQLAHLVAMRDQIQERADAFFLKVAIQPANMNTLPGIHKLQDPRDVIKELAFVDEQHIRRCQFFGAPGFQLGNGRAHDAGDHGTVVCGKQ